MVAVPSVQYHCIRFSSHRVRLYPVRPGTDVRGVEVRYSLLPVLALALFAVSVSADTMEITIPFDPSSVTLSTDGVYTHPRLPGMSLIEVDGQPRLPTLPVRVALPTGCRATSLEVVDAVFAAVPGRHRIAPAGPCFPLSLADQAVPSTPDLSIYSLDEAFPSITCELSSSGAVWGIPMAWAMVYPVRWNPARMELEILQHLTVEIEYGPDPASMLISRRAASSETAAMDLARRMVVNPGDVSLSGASLRAERDLKFGQYVIIAHPSFIEIAQELADWKTAKGVPARVFTTAWIDTEFPGFDLQQKIRHFLALCRDEGTDWVLIFGDDDMVRARDVYMSDGYEEDYAPSDLYFADINDVDTDLWDLNGDQVWGGPDDRVDYHPDMWVGRASVTTTDEAGIFVDKVLTYEAAPSTLNGIETASREMSIGYTTGILWEGYSGAAGAEIISGYLPASGWEENKCYEETGNSRDITFRMIDDGPHHVFHSSHGGPTMMYTSYGSLYTTDDIMIQTNISSGGLPAIWNSIACEIGQLDEYECCGDAWLASPGGGGFGAFNARYGWGHYGEPGYGPSERICERFYYEHLVAGVIPLGQAHLVSMDHFAPPEAHADSFDVAILDWCIKEYNLFGDPEIPMWTETARDLSIDHPASISGNTQVTVTVTAGGAPVADARVCLQKGDWQTGDIYEVGFTDASGQVTLYAGPESTGDITVTATAHNCNPLQGIITVTGLGVGGGVIPSGTLTVHPVVPCPASVSLAVTFSTPSTGTVAVEAFDLAGRMVSRVFEGELAAGVHEIQWNLSADDGTPLPSGIYRLRVSSGGAGASTQAVIVR